MDTDFASYHSKVTANGDKLHYEREFVIKQIDLPADAYPKLRMFEGTIAADENNNAVLKRK